MTRRKPRIYFDVEAPHKKAGKPLAYHFPLLAKLHLKGPYRKHKKAALYTGAAGLVVVLVLAFQIPALFANVRSFAPATCSGDWSNPTALLEGESGGAAVATDAGQKIFCSFASLNLKEPVELKRAMLVLSFDSPLIPAPESNTEDPALEVQEEENTEATEESQPAEEEPVPSEEGGSSEPEPTPESPTEIPEPEPTPEPVIETPASEPATEAPAAFLFAKVAHAQEAETPAEPAPVEEVPVEEVILEEEPPAEEPVTEVVEEEPAEEEVVEEPVEEAIEESVSTPAEPEGSELTISYTTDGEIWTEVTTFTPRGNEVTFDLAVPTTAEFERLVIRLTADSIVKDIELWDLEVRIWTETPLDQLLEPLPVEDVVGSHVFNREFTIDPDASHYCVFEPLTVDLSSGTTTTFTLSLKKGDDLGQGISGFVADVSEAILEAITDEPLPEPVVEEPVIEPAATTTEEIVVEEPITEEVVEETASTTEEEIASTTEETSVEEVASTTEEEERGIIEEIVESGIETLEQLARLRVGLLEIGSLPVGIDIRFIGDTPYLVELFDDSPETFTLSANVFALEGAQEGSFSVPLVFTRTDGKESTVVCQINVLNRPGSVPMYVPAEPAPEPELESVEEPAP